MPSSGIRRWHHKLQDAISPDDQKWVYTVPALPRPSQTNPQGLLKAITVISNDSKQCIELTLSKVSLNRAISHEPLDRFISISFANFRLYYPIQRDPKVESSQEQAQSLQPAPPKETANYVVRLLRSGINLNTVHYNFYGHSNSQLKSKTCFLFSDSRENISKKVSELGEFSNIKTVAKKAKRIGLLFSTAEMAIELQPDRCEDISDVISKDYIFTDGCGLISVHLAKLLVKQADIKYRNQRYLPSVYQIRYRGYKGVLMLEPTLKGQILVKFRDSMKKFKGGTDLSFSVVNYSKPYNFGYLNDEVVLLLHSLGIPETTLLRKQQEHFDFLAAASINPQDSFRFLTYQNNLKLAEKVLMEGIEPIRDSILSLVNQEREKMLNKRDQQRCRIMVPQSRLLYGICDSKDILREGECVVRVTMEGDGQPRQLSGMEILVTRNPCLHPGDLQKFNAVARPELAHLIDCIVFPTRGRRPSADLMSGGDLDGDTFFVCWDSDLIPTRLSQPAHYEGAKEPISFRTISDDDRLEYFARYSNASLGRVKNLYLDWARMKGPMSRECQELNHLFSTCVDGNRIKVPKRLENLPPTDLNGMNFILDTLHDAAKVIINNHEKRIVDCNDYSYGALQLLLSRDDVAMSEFELLRLTYRWCLKNKAKLVDFLGFFDLTQLVDEEKAWLLFNLPQTRETSSLVLNALTQSKLITESELLPFKLHYPGLHWKLLFDSGQDRMARFFNFTSRALELFHKKLLVLRIDTRLTIAIYIPRQIEKRKECQVDNTVRLFAFPHTQGNESFQRRAVPTKMNYRLYCDDSNLQLYETTRANTWVFLTRPAADDSTYRAEPNQGDRRRQRQVTVDQGQNHDCVASIALDKYSRGLQRHIGRVNRAGVLGAELYAISNHDVKSLQILDLWLEFVDTEEIVPIFDKEAREYKLPRLSMTDWSTVPAHLRTIARDGDLAPFKNMENVQSCIDTLDWLLERNERRLLFRSFDFLLESVRSDSIIMEGTGLLQTLVTFLRKAPYLSVTFAKIGDWANLKPENRATLIKSAPNLLEAIVLAVNAMEELAIGPFREILSQLTQMSPDGFGYLVEKIALTVHSPKIALDLLLDLDLLLKSFDPESQILPVGCPKNAQHYLKNLIGIALDHIDEADEATKSQRPREELLDLEKGQDAETVVCNMRIDAPAVGVLKLQDHVRLITATSPSNIATDQMYSMDALVESSEYSRVKLRCLHPLPSFVEECSWKIQNCGSFVTCKTMFDALNSFATEPEHCCEVHDHILGLPSSESESSSNSDSYTERNDLNQSQNRAVQVSLTHALTCLWGPPGTGKTHTIVVILQELLRDVEDRRVLVTAPTHNAVDNVLRKYINEGTQDQEAFVEPIRVTTDVRKVAEDLRKYTCDAMVGQELNENFAARRKAQTRVKSSRIIFTTCIGAGLGLLRKERFDTVIIDEASQQTEPESLVPLVKGCRKAILVGDHLQLRATVQRHAVLQNFDVSLFERLYTQDSTEVQKVMLDTQYRMHREICSFTSREFYNNNLQTAVADTTRAIPDSEFPWPNSQNTPNDNARMILVQCSTTEDLGRKSKSNKGQAAVSAEICRRLMMTLTPSSSESNTGSALPPPSIAILTPYTAQAELLRRSVPSVISVSSIDGFQGREADIIIFVTVRCNVNGEIGFLKDLRRLNVAMTRAKAGCIVVGDRATLTKGPDEEESTRVWKRLIDSLVPVDISIPS